MFLFFITISIVNLALGYFLAVKYHQVLFAEPARERDLVRPGSGLNDSTPPFTIDASQMPLVKREPPLVAVPPEKQPEPASDPPEELSAESPTTTEVVLPAMEVSFDNSPDVTESLLDSAEPASSVTGVSLDDFMQGLQAFRAQLSNLDQRVRECAKSPETREIEGCLQEFRAANSRYLEQTTEAAERLEEADAEETEDQLQARTAVKQALASQAEEVRRAEDELSQLDVSSDLQGSCETMLRSANDLSTVNDQLREEIHIAQRAYEPETADAVEPVTEGAMFDEWTQLPSRKKFDQVVRQQAQSGNPFCLGLVDLDHCGKLNLEHGQEAVDQVLKAIGQIVGASARGNVFAARYAGQQFVLLFPNEEAAEASLPSETVRQIVEKTSFQREGTTLEVSVSVILAPVAPTETLTTIEQRLRLAVAAAKSFGRNRTFQYRDGDVEPLLPPELEIESSTCEV